MIDVNARKYPVVCEASGEESRHYTGANEICLATNIFRGEFRCDRIAKFPSHRVEAG